MEDKLKGNGILNSRMIMPEHREAEIRLQLAQARRTKPELILQESELIEAAISRSLTLQVPVKLRLFDMIEDCWVAGVVKTVLTYRREVKLVSNGELTWIALDDVLDAKIDRFGE
ncbi:YolD-like family protein [Paenibacillus tuaregi]|uniref:YolD-like family protein n=1 Tax=Paenibacillus tuaregi TaxID=1816681 RepID=UPI000839382E|nr:YolD-like family protein [Paenibacillus tuaregi]